MASQITHVALAKKFLDTEPNNFKRSDFYVGTVFPDIRYLRVIDRSLTHTAGLNLETILKEADSFTAGFNFHSFLDDAREDFMLGKNIYALVPESKYVTQALKLNEDIVLYDKVDNWLEIAANFNQILPEEQTFNIKDEAIAKWHKLNADYFKQAPNTESRRIAIKALGFSEEASTEIENLIIEMRKIPDLRNIINEFYSNF